MDDDDMMHNPSYSWHPANIWNDDLRKKRKAYNEALLRGERVRSSAAGTPILRAVLGAPSSAGYFYASIFGSGGLSALFCFSDDPFGSFFSFLPSILLRHKSEKPA